MYYYSFEEQKWTQVHYDVNLSIAIPTPRAGHSMIYFENQKCLYFFGGGSVDQMFNDLFIFDIEKHVWLLPVVKGDIPTPRASHSANQISENQFCIFGGGDTRTGYNDVFLYNTKTYEWHKITTAGEMPDKRAGHSSNLVSG